MNIRPATAEDLQAVDGMAPARTCRALVAEESGRTLAIFGIYPMNTRYVMFSHATDEFRRNKRRVVMGIRAMQSLIASRPAMPLLAYADPEIPGSDVLLKHMGFEPFNERVYQCLGHKRSLPRSQ